MRSIIKNFLIFFLLFLALASLFSLYSSSTATSTEVGVDRVIAELENEQVKSITVSSDELTVVLKNDEVLKASKESSESLSELVKNYGVDPAKLRAVTVEIKGLSGLQFWLATLLPFLIPFVLIVGFIYFMSRQIQGANMKALSFGQSRARETDRKDKKRKITFKDVAGCKEAKEELKAETANRYNSTRW